VCRAGGFIGGHLVKKLKSEGYWVRAVDIKEHEYCRSAADEFLLLDLRRERLQSCVDDRKREHRLLAEQPLSDAFQG
jgi:GDP-D-mannose 3',5'-epimerase